MSNNKKILLCGCFDFGGNDNGGQTVKGRELYYALCDFYGQENIDYVDTKGWKKHPFSLFVSLLKKAKHSEYMIMLPAHNGLKVFSRVFRYFKKRKSKKIYYDVVGGWLAEKLKNGPSLKRVLLDFDGIWVETTSMKRALDDLGFERVHVLPNFKNLTKIAPEELDCSIEKPYKLCTFSRVIKEKGIEDAINAVNEINGESGETIFSLDIYGQIDEGYAARFEELRSDFPEYIAYKGMVHPSKSVETLRGYTALLFPTHYYTEGVPGTLIDAMAAAGFGFVEIEGRDEDLFIPERSTLILSGR